MDAIQELARMIDHSLLHPTMTDTDLEKGCAIARTYGTASVCIKPYAVRQAADWLRGSGVAVGTVVGFPHGSSAVATKVAETTLACRDGATEIDVVVNVGKVLSEDWVYAHDELLAIKTACDAHGALLKVIFENDFLPDDRFKIHLCQLCTDLGVAFVKTSTGYGFVKQADGSHHTAGATEHDLLLMRQHAGPSVQVKAAGGVRTLDDLLRVKALGVTRVGATATVAILEEAKRRFGLAPGISISPTVPTPTDAGSY